VRRLGSGYGLGGLAYSITGHGECCVGLSGLAHSIIGHGECRVDA